MEKSILVSAVRHTREPSSDENRVSSKNTVHTPIQDVCNCGGKRCEHNPYQFGVLWLGDAYFLGLSILISGSVCFSLYVLTSRLLHTTPASQSPTAHPTTSCCIRFCSGSYQPAWPVYFLVSSETSTPENVLHSHSQASTVNPDRHRIQFYLSTSLACRFSSHSTRAEKDTTRWPGSPC